MTPKENPYSIGRKTLSGAERLANGSSGNSFAGMPVSELTRSAMTADEVKRLVERDVLGEEARAASLIAPEFIQTAGVRGAPRRGEFQMVRNGNWDNALNFGADAYGILGELPGLKSDLARL